MTTSERRPGSSLSIAVPGFRRRLPVFLAWGIVGVVAGTSLGCALALSTGRSAGVVVAMSALSVLGFVVVSFGTKVVTGEENFTFFHQAITAQFVAAGLLIALREPVLPYLDVSATGLFTFLVFGRLGCLMVGCCHGRPSRIGRRYGPVHEAEGFPPALVGVPLMPVPAFESLASAVIAAGGVVVVLGHGLPGTALVWCFGAYAAVRFGLEFARGDVTRRYWRGLSVPQWTSVTIAVSGALLAGVRILPLPVFAGSVALILIAAVLVIQVLRRGPLAGHDLLGPQHLHELVHLLAATENALPSGLPGVWQTRHGLLLSVTDIPDQGRGTRCYSLSHATHVLDVRTATGIGRLISVTRHPDLDWSVVAGSAEVFHVLVNQG